MARPIKFTPERAEGVLDGIRKGLSRTRAARLVGISHDTIRRWAERFPEFAMQLEQADAQFVLTHVSGIASYADAEKPNSWTARAWLLERTHPDEFGQKSRLDITLDTEQFLAEMAEKFGLTTEEVQAVAEARIAAKAPGAHTS